LGEILDHRDVLLLVATISRYEDALAWTETTLTKQWGPVAIASPAFSHDETTYYQATMGEGLKKQFFAFENLVAPNTIVEAKRQTNLLEQTYQQKNQFPEPRPLNLDPGYISEAKLVLATTKDRDHRIYLDRGIFAEVTLHFHRGQWQARPWTYPDYQREDFKAFFTQCRNYLRDRYKSSSKR